MPEGEPNRGRISSLFNHFSESADGTANSYRELKRSIVGWAGQIDNPQRAARFAITYSVGVALDVAKKGTLLIRDGAKKIADITKNRI